MTNEAETDPPIIASIASLAIGKREKLSVSCMEDGLRGQCKNLQRFELSHRLSKTKCQIEGNRTRILKVK